MSESQKPQRTATRLHAALTLVLTLLIGAGFTLQFTNESAVKAEASQSPSVTETQTHTSVTPTLTSEPSPTDPDPQPDPILEGIAAHQKAHGCNFNSAATTLRVLGTCKILLVGDSIGNNLGYGMLGQLGRYPNLKFVLRAKASTGLSNAWFYNWETNLKRYLVAEKPDMVIVLLGANDRQNIKVGSNVYTYGTAAWKRVYSESVGRMAKLATDAGAYIHWVGMPICKPYNYNKGMELIASLTRIELAKHSGTSFSQLHTLTADAAGNYTQYLTVNGVRTKVRGDDGIHFTGPGQSVIGSYIIKRIYSLYHVNLKSSSPRVVTK
jgi:hypothetical protein